MLWLQNTLQIEFSDISKREMVPADTFLSGDHIYFLFSGLCLLGHISERGDEKVLVYFKENALMGFLPYLLKQMAGEVPNPGTLETGEFFIKTCSVCRVLKINGNQVFQRLDKTPHLYHALIGALTQNYVNVLYLSTRITNQPAVIRICRVLLEFGVMENGRLSLPRHFTYYNIGTYTSLHVITVTKIFKALLKAGIISRKGHKIFVEKKKELEDITERQRDLHY